MRYGDVTDIVATDLSNVQNVSSAAVGAPAVFGGYAYRLCQVKRGKVWKTTEKCFQKGHLNFHGKLRLLVLHVIHQFHNQFLQSLKTPLLVPSSD